MKYQLSNDNIQCFSAVSDIVRKGFDDEQKRKFDDVIFKINNADTTPEGYEVEINKDEQALIADLFAKLNKNEEIKNSSRFKDLRKVFGIEKKDK